MYSEPIVDTHFHTFRRADVQRVGLMSAEVLQRDFTVADYENAWAGANVVGSVAVQVIDDRDGMSELAFVEEVASRTNTLRKYVTFCPVDAPRTPEYIAEIAHHPLVAGLRYNQAFGDKGALLYPDRARNGAKLLAEHKLTYDVCLRPWQYAGFLELAAQTPDTMYVVNHLGKPRLQREPQPDWLEGIRRMAVLPNVVCKVSVAIDTRDDGPYDIEVVRPLVRHVVDNFGYDRVMFGSNYPVSTISVGFGEWLQMLEEILADATTGELERLYQGNARRVYVL